MLTDRHDLLFKHLLKTLCKERVISMSDYTTLYAYVSQVASSYEIFTPKLCMSATYPAVSPNNIRKSKQIMKLFIV
jgi:hypothetical protein